MRARVMAAMKPDFPPKNRIQRKFSISQPPNLRIPRACRCGAQSEKSFS